MGEENSVRGRVNYRARAAICEWDAKPGDIDLAAYMAAPASCKELGNAAEGFSRKFPGTPSAVPVTH